MPNPNPKRHHPGEAEAAAGAPGTATLEAQKVLGCQGPFHAPERAGTFPLEQAPSAPSSLAVTAARDGAATTRGRTLLLPLTASMCDSRAATQFIFPLAPLPSAHPRKKRSACRGRCLLNVPLPPAGSCFQPVKCHRHTRAGPELSGKESRGIFCKRDEQKNRELAGKRTLFPASSSSRVRKRPQSLSRGFAV